MFWKIFGVFVVGLVFVTYLGRVETVGYDRGIFVQETTKGGTLNEKIFRVCQIRTRPAGPFDGINCTQWGAPSIFK